jgi:hypothetical protein
MADSSDTSISMTRILRRAKPVTPAITWRRSLQGPNDIVVSLEGSRLMIDSSGGGKIPLIAHSETNFTMEGTGVDFVKDAV